MTFRHPLRNEWDRVSAHFERMAKSPGRDGVMARLMLDVTPVFIAALERERDKRTHPLALFDAIAAASGMMIENVIEHHPRLPPRAALQRMQQMIQTIVEPRVVSKRSAIIRPEGYSHD